MAVEFRKIGELTQPSVAIWLSTNVHTKVTKAIRTSLFQEVSFRFTSWNALPSY
jgi:hypothetical protein